MRLLDDIGDMSTLHFSMLRFHHAPFLSRQTNVKTDVVHFEKSPKRLAQNAKTLILILLIKQPRFLISSCETDWLFLFEKCQGFLLTVKANAILEVCFVLSAQFDACNSALFWRVQLCPKMHRLKRGKVWKNTDFNNSIVKTVFFHLYIHRRFSCRCRVGLNYSFDLSK